MGIVQPPIRRAWTAFLRTAQIPFETREEMGLLYFWLPERNAWMFTSELFPSEKEEERLVAFAKKGQRDVYVFHGDIPYRTDGVLYDDEDNESGHRVLGEEGFSSKNLWCECPQCGLIGISFEGDVEPLPCRCCCRDENPQSLTLLRAYAAARSVYDDINGFACFIRAGENGPIYVGWSGDVKDRLAHLQEGNSNDLLLLATIPGKRSLEGKLHSLLASYRLRGAWFEPSPDLLTLIDLINLAR